MIHVSIPTNIPTTIHTSILTSIYFYQTCHKRYIELSIFVSQRHFVGVLLSINNKYSSFKKNALQVNE